MDTANKDCINTDIITALRLSISNYAITHNIDVTHTVEYIIRIHALNDHKAVYKVISHILHINDIFDILMLQYNRVY